MKLDLHCHSTASDGKLPPLALLQLAEEAELDYWALTDHDTVAGFMQLQSVETPVKIISGIEISTLWSGVGIHIIGLDFDAEHESMQALIKAQRKAREARAYAIDKKLASKGMPDTLAGALQYCPDLGQIGRPHFAQFMLERGYVTSEKQAFDKWLGNGKIGDVKSQWPTVEEAVAVINTAGGIAVLAHPLRYKLTFSKLRRLSAHFSEVGGKAIEVIGHQVSPDKKKQLLKMAADLDLAASGGSDFHDPLWRWAQLGKLPPLPTTLKPVWQLFK